MAANTRAPPAPVPLLAAPCPGSCETLPGSSEKSSRHRCPVPTAVSDPDGAGGEGLEASRAESTKGGESWGRDWGGKKRGGGGSTREGEGWAGSEPASTRASPLIFRPARLRGNAPWVHGP